MPQQFPPTHWLRSTLIATAMVSMLTHPWTASAALDSDPQSWTRFRGPNGSGIGFAPGLPALFAEQDYRWKTPLPGKGHSSPVIANGKVFVTCTPAEGAKRILVAADETNGKIVWQKEWETAAFRQHADNSYTSASPAVDGERVFLWWTSPEQSWIAALDQKDGREVWRHELGGFVSQHGAGSSPIVFEDMVILDFCQEGSSKDASYTIALEAKTGKVRWKTPRESDSATASTPCLYQPKDGGEPQLIVVGRTSGMTSLNPRTGKVNWDIADLLPKRCVASPVVTDGGLVIAQCGEGQAESFVAAVRPGADGKPPEKVYQVIRTGGYVPCPLPVGDLLYLWKENGLVTCLRAATNEQLWSERVEGPFYGSPVCISNRLYNMTRRGELVVLAAGEKFEMLGRIPLGEGSYATPAVANGRLFLRTFTNLICVGK